VAVAAVGLIPLATEMPALAALGVLAGLLVALVTYERIRFHDTRARLRERLVHP
jgi:hypothetical protein